MALMIAGIDTAAFAQPKPGGYITGELNFGELGAIFGGAMMFYGAVVVGWSIVDRDLLPICRHYYSSCALHSYMLNINSGRALGASIGVMTYGSSVGVEGNIWGTFVATGVWFAVTTLLPSFFPDTLDGLLSLGIIPGIPAVLATIGYNIGATMKSDKSKSAALSWNLPLVALKF
jgi:hypothetical protein